MRCSALILALASLCQLAAAKATGHAILKPISDDGWDHSITRRAAVTNPAELQENEHFVWGSTDGMN
jgi:hypothetical protein